MKLLLTVMTVAFSLNASAKVIGGKTFFAKMSATCSFPDFENKRLEAKFFSRGPSSEILFANVVITEGNQKSYYRMSYVDPGELSLVFSFENVDDDTALEIYGDDVGRMSSLKLGDDKFDLTCSMN
jgi:hypothetical protein